MLLCAGMAYALPQGASLNNAQTGFVDNAADYRYKIGDKEVSAEALGSSNALAVDERVWTDGVYAPPPTMRPRQPQQSGSASNAPLSSNSVASYKIGNTGLSTNFVDGRGRMWAAGVDSALSAIAPGYSSIYDAVRYSYLTGYRRFSGYLFDEENYYAGIMNFSSLSGISRMFYLPFSPLITSPNRTVSSSGNSDEFYKLYTAKKAEDLAAQKLNNVFSNSSIVVETVIAPIGTGLVSVVEDPFVKEEITIDVVVSNDEPQGSSLLEALSDTFFEKDRFRFEFILYPMVALILLLGIYRRYFSKL